MLQLTVIWLPFTYLEHVYLKISYWSHNHLVTVLHLSRFVFSCLFTTTYTNSFTTQLCGYHIIIHSPHGYLGLITVNLQDIHLKKPFKSSVTKEQQVISRSTIPRSILEVYSKCDTPPALDKLNAFRYSWTSCVSNVLLFCVIPVSCMHCITRILTETWRKMKRWLNKIPRPLLSYYSQWSWHCA